MRYLIRVEMRKILKRRFSWIMLGVLLLISGLSALLVATQIDFTISGSSSGGVTGSDEYIFGFDNLRLHFWYPLVIAVVIMGGDVASGALAAGLTRVPNRLTHLWSRILVYGSTVWIDLMVALGLWFLIIKIFEPEVPFISAGEFMAGFWRFGFTTFFWVILTVATVAVMRSTGGAVGAVMGFWIFELFVTATWEAFQRFSVSQNTALLNLASEFDSSQNSVPEAVLALSGWMVAFLIIGIFGMYARDV